MKYSVFILFIMTVFASCNQKTVKDWPDEEIDQWFAASDWNTKLKMKPDGSINKRLFVEQNVLNPKSWEAAYKFLNESDFNAMALGRYDLLDDGTYANIEEYATKDSAGFEAHRKYIDIQCLAKGKEYIHVSPYEPDRQVGATAYDETRDIEFFNKGEYEKHLLSTDNFLVLFPSDGHRPCMKADTSEVVRKVVVKIPYMKQ